MTKEELNSDKVNYLIYRYLQESNYLGTAVKLQAEWDTVDPQSLDFAPHVQSHALVHLLQRGLLFHEAERRATQRRQPSPANAVGFFGPVPPLSPPLAAEEDPINARKRTSEERPQQSRQTSPAKRAKLSNGYENGIIEPTPMDLDEQDTTDANSNNGHVYPSPEEIDFEHSQPAAPAPATHGPEKATQAEKPHDLKHDAHCVSLKSDTTEGHPIITQCEWNPKDSEHLITIGIDVRPRNWKIEKRQAPGLQGGFSMVFEDLLAKKEEITGSVTYVSWSNDGSLIAVASDCDNKGKVTVIGEDRDVAARFVSAGHPPIFSLRWNTTNQYLLALTAPDVEGGCSWVTIYDLAGQDSVAHKLEPGSQPVDAQWTKDGSFVICDGETLIHFRHTPGAINKVAEYPGNEGPILLCYDAASSLLATATDSGKLIVWDGSVKYIEVQAHDGQVTSLMWQPNNQEGVALLATSCEDKTVKIWKMLPEKSRKPLQTLDLGSGVLDLSFTPRGDFLAAATNAFVGIWDMSDSSNPTVPIACWFRGKEPGWQSPKQTNGHVPEEDHHTLKWDSQGLKLAYGVNSMLAVIEFDPTRLSINGLA